MSSRYTHVSEAAERRLMATAIALVAIFANLLASKPSAAAGSDSTLEILEAPIYATAINSHGQIAGHRLTSGPAVLWENGRVTELGTLGGRFSRESAINDLGQIVGYSNNGIQDHAFLWQDGLMRDLGSIGDGTSFALGINNRSQVVGFFSLPNGDTHAFLWEDGRMQDLGTLGGHDTWATAINDAGQITGQAQNAQGERLAFLWEDGEMQDLGTLGGTFTTGIAINNEGQVAGTSRLSGDLLDHAFIWEDGEMEDLGSLGDFGSYANAMNDDGVVVGSSSLLVGSRYRSRPFITTENGLVDLNSFLPPGSNVELMTATSISNNYQIVGATCETYGGDRCARYGRAYVLTLGDEARTRLGPAGARRSSAPARK